MVSFLSAVIVFIVDVRSLQWVFSFENCQDSVSDYMPASICSVQLDAKIAGAVLRGADHGVTSGMFLKCAATLRWNQSSFWNGYN